jgi:hypothetical protein
MFHPENKLRTSWDFFVLAVTVFATIEIPDRCAFEDLRCQDWYGDTHPNR